MPTTKKQSVARTRNFATVIYPESAPDNWLEILEELHVPCLISPLHDKDVNPNGEQKKPHYHVLIMFESMKNYETQVRPIFDTIGGVGRENVNSARGYARYLIHKDNPEKYQYKAEDVKAIGGADYNAVISLPSDDIKAVREMIEYIRNNQITSFCNFVDFCAINNEEWFNLLCHSKSYFIKEYIKSLAWQLHLKEEEAEQ